MTSYEYQVAEAQALLRFMAERSKRIELAINTANETKEAGFEAPAEAHLTNARAALMGEFKHVGEKGHLP